VDAADLSVGDYGDLDCTGYNKLRRLLNEERCRQLGDTSLVVFLLNKCLRMSQIMLKFATK
jgi:hypothetical protein